MADYNAYKDFHDRVWGTCAGIFHDILWDENNGR